MQNFPISKAGSFLLDPVAMSVFFVIRIALIERLLINIFGGRKKGRCVDIGGGLGGNDFFGHCQKTARRATTISLLQFGANFFTPVKSQRDLISSAI